MDELKSVGDGSHPGDRILADGHPRRGELILGRTGRGPEVVSPGQGDGTERRFGDMGSTFTQAERLLLPGLGLPRSVLLELFPMPGVAVFAGHMINRPGRPRPQFPGGARRRR